MYVGKGRVGNISIWSFPEAPRNLPVLNFWVGRGRGKKRSRLEKSRGEERKGKRRERKESRREAKVGYRRGGVYLHAYFLGARSPTWAIL